MQKIFISYSRKDMDFVRKLAGDLEKAGYDVWWDITDLHGGDDWVRTIPVAIETSQFIVVVLSPNSVASEWVEKEYTEALSLRKKIIPIMLAPCSVPFALNTINFTNFSTGEYADNFKNLLSGLGHTGETPAVTPFIKPTLFLPQALRRFVIPITVGIILFFVFILRSQPKPVVATPTITPTFHSSATATGTPEPATLTATVTVSSTSTITQTLTPTPTLTVSPSPTKRPFESLGFCVLKLRDMYAINVRTGPSSTNYVPLGGGLRVGKCLTFSAVIVNEEEETWLLVANGQTDPDMQQYEGGWIRRDLLIPEELTGPINLPIVTLTATLTSTLTPTITPSATPSSTPTITPTPTATDTRTPTSTNTSTPTLPPSPTPTETDTPAS
jgi:hypothetical protein